MSSSSFYAAADDLSGGVTGITQEVADGYVGCAKGDDDNLSEVDDDAQIVVECSAIDNVSRDCEGWPKDFFYMYSCLVKDLHA
ncbi:unnamed protein product [Sphenostylis stenocarpa]|uniref:Uncharacterized protein n=1 Tax=Sphenostylis stenocarpa TaxID=92480 RepID=A0AA86VB77_9FABA|nr:unnamed protein product [Sphenostylis stenocarpa]